MWRFWIDRGGTFTDCLALRPDGEILVTKVLSDDRAPLTAIRTLMELDADAPIPPCEVRMGTTVGTNALLERTGARCALLTTRGFADLLSIGTQARPELFALVVTRPAPLPQRVVEVDARLASDGEVLRPLDLEALRTTLRELRADGIESLAVALLHGHVDGEHERSIEAVAIEEGFDHVALSHRLTAERGLLARADTAVVDAYLTPRLRDYLAGLEAELPGSTLRLMPSSGDLVAADRFVGPASVLSGPAGGVVAVRRLAEQAGLDAVIGFDMGGTSTDVCRIDAGRPQWTYETETAGVRIRAPMLAVHTVAAGGGSICRFDGERLLVGPESASASPGPLCYGDDEARAIALTDVNVVLGRIVDDRFPFPLAEGRSREALAALAPRTGHASPEALAESFFEIAIQHMADAIRQISVARGHDVRSHGLVCFGGAAGQHGCALATRLGIQRLLLHPWAGVLSAYGMGLASVGWHGEREIGEPLGAEALTRAEDASRQLEAEGRATLAADGIDEPRFEVRISLRYQGTETDLTVELSGDEATVRDAFEQAHRRRFGYVRDATILLTAVRVRGTSPPAELAETADPPATGDPPTARMARLWHEGAWHDAPVIHREHLAPDHVIRGPAIVAETTGTVVVDPGFSLRVDARGWLWLERPDQPPPPRASVERDPMWLELFHHQFTSIAEEMGRALRRTAQSTNIRERLDFSCALFDADGGLVANAPHIPVHLGAMEETVRAVLADHPEPRPGDAFATNNPARGGSHLPDITVVTPVFAGEGRPLFVASRGHHADVGGITPGSMPATSRRLAEEGVVLRSLPILEGGELRHEALLEALRAGPHPARDPATNVADLEAQLAANQRGANRLGALVEQHGRGTVEAYMRHVQDHAASRVRAMIGALPDGDHTFADELDAGQHVNVRLTIEGEALAIDFSGTSAQDDSNLHAPRAVTVAAVLYVLRLLVGEPIPLASGCLRPVNLTIPAGSLLAPDPDRAVAAGNVETSQRIVDVLLGAFGVSAASQGTMNNLTFGTEGWGYYETLGGGTGATADAHGASAVQCHMTNTRITDAEVLEARYPVRVHRFAVRRGSGGDGRHRGGDGLIREIEALEPLTVTILSERRSVPAFGLDGGASGQVGDNRVVRADGAIVPLGGRGSIDLSPGDRIVVETPGGGGYGPPESVT